MLRLSVTRFASLNSRSFVTGTAQGAAQCTIESGLKSVLAQTIAEHQKKVKLRTSGYGQANYLNSVERRNYSTSQMSSSLLSANGGRETLSESSLMIRLERAFARFEEVCQRNDKVNQNDFVRTFDNFTRVVSELESLGPISEDVKVNLSVLSGMLIRCCGRLMSETPRKAREMLAGNVWQFIKEKQIPLDTPLYNSLIKILNENHTIVEPQTLMDEMKAANLQPDRVTYQRLIHQYCVQGNVTSAASLLEVMKEKNMSLNEATFASLIIGYSLQENRPSIDEMFELMRTNGIEPGSQSYSAAIISQTRLLEKDTTKATEELGKLNQMIRDQDIQFNVYEIGDLLLELSPSKENDTVNKIVERLVRAGLPNTNNNQRLFGVLVDCGQLEEASNQFWSQHQSERAIKSGKAGNYYIRLLATSKNVPIDHAISECSRLIATNTNPSAFHLLYYLAATVGNLALVRASLKKIGETEPLKCHYYWPLLAQAQNNDELLNVLKNDMNPKMNSTGLLETFSDWVWPKFSQNYNELLERNKSELKYDNGLLTASYLDYCVGSDKILDAVKFISELPAQETPDQQEQTRSEEDSDQQDADGPIDSQDQSLRFDRDNLLSRLLFQVADRTKDPALVDKAFELCKFPGLNYTSRMLTPLIKSRLDHSENFNDVLDHFTNIAEKYGVTPCKFDLIIRCLEAKDSEGLQKIMDVSSKIYGETNSLFDLACACVKIGKMKQANKVLSSPGFRINPKRVYTACRSMTRNLEALENFVFATKELPDVNQDYLYEILLDAYERSDNHGRALDLWNRMQEEDFQPTKGVLISIARVLKVKDIPVPFRIPKEYSRGSY